MFRFKVADIVMDYYPYHEEFFGRRLSSYLCDEEKSDMRLEYKICENIELPTHKITSKVHEATVGVRDNGNLIMYFKAKSGKVIYYVEHNEGGAWQTVQYAIRQGKTVINLAEKTDI